MKKLRTRMGAGQIAAILFALGGSGVTAEGAQQSFCAEVQMVIEQTLTLERQAFDAHMRIRNGIRAFSLDDIKIDVTVTDTNGNPVTITANAQNTNATFFIRIDSLENVSNIAGTGVVAPESTADIHWLIIPSASAGGKTSSGVRYLVGANLSYAVNAETQTVAVAPDTITVKPMPKLALDYFLPYEVYGDEPFTEQIEAPVPYSLGVRIKNVGAGEAHALKIESGEPKIVENTRGLLIGFDITESEVQGVKSENRLTVDFGTLASNRVKVARWTMECSLSGHFTSFAAEFAHSDDLGGELTSLIQGVNTHTLLRDVLVDLDGRDRVRDFLAQDGNMIRAFESESYELGVSNRSEQAQWTSVSSSGGEYVYQLTIPVSSETLYVKKGFDDGAGKILVRAIRADGKSINLANAWIHKERERQEDPWQYFFCLFDARGGGDYTVVFKNKPVTLNEAPVLQHIGRKVVRAGESLGFIVRATDPNETVPELSAQPVPTGATFSGVAGDGTFMWTPAEADYGVHLVRFAATDGAYTDWEVVKIYVGHAGEALCDSLPCSLKDWKVNIKDLAALTSSGNATVLWDTVNGVPYETFYSDQPFGAGMSWNKIGETRQGQGFEASMADSSLDANRDRRFYCVVVAGDAPASNGVWGVIRRGVGVGYTMISPPLAMDRKFNGDLGRSLAEVLTGNDGGVGDNTGDEVYVLQADGSWRALYLDSNKAWRESNGTVSTYEVPAGAGFFVARQTAGNVKFTFTGPVGNQGDKSIAIQPGWNLLGLSEGVELPLNQVLGDSVAVGGTSEEDADVLVIQNVNGSWRRLMRVEGWGAPYDGNWFDLSTFQIYTNRLQPGDAYYYYRQPVSGSTEVNF